MSGFEKLTGKYINVGKQLCLELCSSDKKCLAGVHDTTNNICWKYETFESEFPYER